MTATKISINEKHELSSLKSIFSSPIRDYLREYQGLNSKVYEKIGISESEYKAIINDISESYDFDSVLKVVVYFKEVPMIKKMLLRVKACSGF